MKELAKNSLLYIFMVAVLVLAGSLPAQAHRVNVFAWLEGDRVVVECAFPRSQPVNKGQVTVYDNVTNKELLQGRTDAAGHFSFKVPEVVREGHGLRIEINAGQGHVSDWVMAADELYEAAALTAGLDRARIAENNIAQKPHAPAAQPAHRQLPPQQAQNIVQANMPMPATPDHVRQIVNEALDARLAPLHKHMAAMENRGAGIVEIFGGIGWIIGLVGLWMYYRSRRKD